MAFSNEEIAIDYVGKIGNHAVLPGYLKNYFPEQEEKPPQSTAQWLADNIGEEE